MDGEQEILVGGEGTDGGTGGDQGTFEPSDAGGGGGVGTLVEEHESATVEYTESSEQGEGDQQRPQVEKEEPELGEFRGMIAAKLRGIIKKAPELAGIFKKNPDIQNMVEAVFRREAALREVFPTVAEARFMRDQFPNGQADVQALLEDVGELTKLDQVFDTPGEDGTYPGHAELVGNFFERDQKAAVALMRRIPKEWAKRDPESYNEVMSKVVAATFHDRGIPEFLSELVAEAEGTDLQPQLKKLQGWVNGFFADKLRPSEEQLKLQRDRQDLERQRSTVTKAESQRFHGGFVAASKKIQVEAVSSHPAIRRLEKTNAISPEKRRAIIEEIRVNTERLLSKSPSFMRQLRPAYEKRDLQECEKLQRAAWAQPWLINKMVRTVLQREIPQVVQQGKDAVRRRTAGQQAPAKKPGDQQRQAPKGPYKDADGRWHRPDGTAFSTADVLAGRHLSA